MKKIERIERSVTFSEADMARLQALADEQECSVSSIIRRAVKAYLRLLNGELRLELVAEADRSKDACALQ